MKLVFSLFLVFTNSFLIYSQSSCRVSSSYFIDTFSEFKNPNQLNDKLILFNQNQIVKVGFNSNASVWLKFKFTNHSNFKSQLLLSFPNIHIDSLICFDSISKMNNIIGDRTKNKGDYSVSHVFKVKLKPRSNRIVWIKLKKIISFFDFSYEIGNRQELEKGSTKNLIFNAVFIGLISMLILLNLILYIITKIRTYLLYVIYSFLTIVYLAITTGFAKFYILPEFVWVSEVRVYSGVFWIILLIHFYKELIDVKAFSRSLHLWINGLSIFNISHVALVFFIPKMDYFNFVQFFWKLGYLIFLAQAVLIFYVVIKKFNAKSKISIYIMLSFIPHICWFIIYILRAFHIVLHEVNYEWLMIIALYEAILFGFVLAYNYVNTMQSNNELNLKVITLKQESIDLISMTQIKERRQISNLIHDKFGSQLAYIKNLINTDNTNLVKEKINELSSEIRNVSHQILPKSLDEGRLCASIANQIQILNETDINCQFSFHSFDFPEVILENWRYDLYLISLEIINNAIKHGNPKEVSVEFYSYDDRYIFQYTDDGLGFDSTNFQKGFGLNSIESRIKNANGIFEINSKLGEGVVVQITFCI